MECSYYMAKMFCTGAHNSNNNVFSILWMEMKRTDRHQSEIGRVTNLVNIFFHPVICAPLKKRMCKTI